MNLSNDKKRREFVQNDENWELVGELNGLVREKMLTYKGTEWYAVEVRQEGATFDYKLKKHVLEKEWRRMNRYKITENHAFSYGVSVTEIMNEIKAIDKKERAK